MRNPAGQLAHGFHLLRLTQLGFKLFPFGDVACRGDNEPVAAIRFAGNQHHHHVDGTVWPPIVRCAT